jgi:hypothetical protein
MDEALNFVEKQKQLRKGYRWGSTPPEIKM